jgi:hypothetical protein
MDSIETILAKKIKEAEQSLDINRADRKVIQVANQDFLNYLNFNTDFLDFKTNTNTKLCRFNKTDHVEVEAFLAVWSGIWLKKWRQRVNLFIGEQNKNERQEAGGRTRSVHSALSCRKEIVELVIHSLIKNTEICGTRIIAENIVDTETDKFSSEDLSDQEKALAVLNSSLRKVREISLKVGPLITVKVDKCYYCEANK